MFALIIVCITAYGAVINVVPNLTKAQCSTLEKHVLLSSMELTIDVRARCIQLPK